MITESFRQEVLMVFKELMVVTDETRYQELIKWLADNDVSYSVK